MNKALFRLLSFLFVSLLSVTLMPNFAYALPPPPTDIGWMITNMHESIMRVPNILTTIAFISGIFLAISGVFKLKDHVDSPHNTPISAGIKRLIAGGFFLALPLTTNMLQGTLFGVSNAEINSGFGWNAPALPPATGLADFAILFVKSFANPMKYLIISFAYISGLAFILIGISRLIKTAQDGPRGPTGMGTLITFLTGSALMQLGMSMGTITGSLFGDDQMKNFVNLNPNVIAALSAAEQDKLINVITAVMVFVSVVGFVAFVRGMYILKAFSDGGQQVSLAQAFTFIIGGALAINLGDLINVIQDTIGVAGLGFTFT